LTSNKNLSSFPVPLKIVGIDLKKTNIEIAEGNSGGSSNLMYLGFSTMKYKSDSDDGSSDKTRTFNHSPRVGYFILNNLTVGFDVNFSLMSYGTGVDKESSTVLGLGPFLRYYMPLEKIAPFLELGGSVGSLRYNYTGWNDEEVTNKSSIRSFIGGIGLAVPIGEMVKFDIMGGYVSTAGGASFLQFERSINTRSTNRKNPVLFFITAGFKLS